MQVELCGKVALAFCYGGWFMFLAVPPCGGWQGLGNTATIADERSGTRNPSMYFLIILFNVTMELRFIAIPNRMENHIYAVKPRPKTVRRTSVGININIIEFL
jgi:hypothetical protein